MPLSDRALSSLYCVLTRECDEAVIMCTRSVLKEDVMLEGSREGSHVAVKRGRESGGV